MIFGEQGSWYLNSLFGQGDYRPANSIGQQGSSHHHRGLLKQAQ